jgi:hypothetical protein
LESTFDFLEQSAANPLVAMGVAHGQNSDKSCLREASPSKSTLQETHHAAINLRYNTKAFVTRASGLLSQGRFWYPVKLHGTFTQLQQLGQVTRDDITNQGCGHGHSLLQLARSVGG